MALKDLIDKSVKNMGEGIHEVVKLSAIELIRRAYAEGIYLFFTSGYRSLEEQAKLYGQGRASFIYKGKQYGNPSKDVVTNAKPGDSNHNYGLAIDFVLTNAEGTQANWTVSDKWKRAAAIAKELGFSWGGDWRSFKDYPHLEMTGGLSTAELKSGKKPNLKIKFTQPSPPKKDETGGKVMKEKFEPSTAALLNSTLTVLNRFERKINEPIDKQWREKTLKGEITESDLVGLLYVAVERGYIGNVDLIMELVKETAVLKSRLDALEKLQNDK